jgi:hypothetical protein
VQLPFILSLPTNDPVATNKCFALELLVNDESPLVLRHFKRLMKIAHLRAREIRKMKRNVLATAGWSAMIALGVIGYGCSSSSTGGSGGATGTGGQAGGATGTGGHGTGGAAGSGAGGSGAGGSVDAGAAPMACASPAPDDKSPCNADPPCTKSCGPNISALTQTRATKTCTCSGTTAASGMWSCPSAMGACVFPTDVDLSCLQLTSPLPLCPTDTPDGGAADAGSGLLRPNTSTCIVASSETCSGVCGSAAANTFTYQDSNGVGKVGYCACIAGKWQCASVAEWPTF